MPGSKTVLFLNPIRTWTEKIPQAFRFSLLAGFILLVGLSVRLVNLKNPPLDYHAWRQLRSATIARAMYYKMAVNTDAEIRANAINLGSNLEILEPQIFERLVSFTYLVIGGEHLWIARLYAIIFWIVGGIAVFLFASELASPIAAQVSTAFYVLLPFGIIASRSFQPDPLMVMWLVWGAYSLYRWSVTHTWRWAISAGVFSGLAVLTKVFAVFPLAVMAVLLTLYNVKSLVILIKNFQTWVVALIMAIIPASYYLFLPGNSASDYLSGWVFAFSELLIKAWFYIRWLDKVHALIDLSWVAIGLVGIILTSGLKRRALVGLWIGYGLLGLSVPSLIISHDYYNLPLIPIIALSLAPPTETLINKLLPGKTFEWLFLLLMFFGALFYPFWSARTALLRDDYRGEVKGWEKLAKTLPKGATYIGLTHDYNMRLRYYGWISITSWPQAADLEMNVLAGGNNDPNSDVWKDIFIQRTQGFDYFIITLYDELDFQPALARILSEYPVIEGDGYRLYDLRNQKK